MPAPWWRRYGPDLLAAGLLVVVAFLARRHGLPTDGLWLDDADPGAAVKAPLSQLMIVSRDHPGYIAVLKGWRDLTGGGGSDSLAYPAFIAGTLGPVLLYLALRRFSYDRSVSFLLGAVLVAAQADIVNSGRVRTFTIDLLIVLGLAMILPRLTRMKWGWRTGVAWIAAAMVVASFSGFALGAILVAGAIVVLHPASDLRVRAVAVGVQAAATIALLRVEGRTYNSATIEASYRQLWDAFPDFHLNPLRFGGELLVHLRRLAEAFPGGPSWLAMLCGLAALAGLTAACFRGRRAIPARYLALLLVATVVGSVLGKVPFGPSQTNPLNNGHRASLWLVPVIAIGLAVVLQGLRRLLADRRTLRIGFDAVAFVAAAAILLSAGPALRYPFPGAKSATEFIESHLGRRDAVILPFHTEWSFAAESDFAVKMQATPDSGQGFDPTSWADPRIHNVDLEVDAPHVAGAVKHAKRAFVYYPALKVGGLLPPESETRAALSSTLRSLGFELQRTVSYHDGNAKVDILRRHGATGSQANRTTAAAGQRTNRRPAASADQINLRLSDFPRAWRRMPSSSNLSAPAIFTCLHVTGAATPSVVSFRTKTLLFVVSQVTHWPSAAGAQSAYTALSGPRAAGCIESVSQSLTARGGGYPVSVIANEVTPPPTGRDPAVAYSTTNRTSIGKVPIGHGTTVFFTHRRTGVLISSLRVGQGPFPSNLLSSLAAAVAGRMNAAGPKSR